jgi:exopolysaccharide production protein ExoQ
MAVRVGADTAVGAEREGAAKAAPRRPTRLSRVLQHTLVVDRPTTAEWLVTLVALFIMGRYPVLFFRERLAGVFGGPPGIVWENDVAIQATFGAAMLMVLILAAKRASGTVLLRQPLLLAFCAWVWASVAWSVEPATSARRALLFLGAAGVGWYLGDRYTLREQIRMAAYVSAVGLVVSLVAIAVWPEFALVTNWILGLVSGAYRSRNHFAPILGLAIMACAFMLFTEGKRFLPVIVGFGAAALFLNSLTGARTTSASLGAAAVAVGLAYVVRSTTGRWLPGWATGLAILAGLGGVGAWVYANFEQVVDVLGRRPTLSGRTGIWEVNLWFVEVRPWTGWGFEAIWAHPVTIELGHQLLGRHPWSSHSGYFEVILGTGWIGMGLLAAFLVFGFWQALLLAGRSRDAASLWPLAILTYVVLHNVSDGYFVSSDFFWALVVAVTVGATEANRRLRLQRNSQGAPVGDGERRA